LKYVACPDIHHAKHEYQTSNLEKFDATSHPTCKFYVECVQNVWVLQQKSNI